jgi:hypothetical protein
VPFTGVIYVMAEAAKHGYRPNNADWCNLGQGQPETGPLPGAPPRVTAVAIDPADQDYAPVPGISELRAAVAELYNQQYRRGLKSQYTEKNVCISGGGRMGLTRAVAALGQINLGHFLPDYTAYEELLDIFKLFTAIPILLDGGGGYRFSGRGSAAGGHRARPVGGALVESVQSYRPSHPGERAQRMGESVPRAPMHVADR